MNINMMLQKIAITAIPIIFAIVIHEVSHGWVAGKCGDPTARQMGRLTLNPIAHIDPFGTILLPLLFIMSGSGFLFAYAKPVPVNFRNLRRPKEDMVWVAGAGPASNLLVAILSAIILKLIASFGLTPQNSWFMIPTVGMLAASVNFNILLAVINLIPIPPADGGRIVVGLLPYRQAISYSKIEPIGMFLLAGLLMFDPAGIFSTVVWPVINNMVRWLLML